MAMVFWYYVFTQMHEHNRDNLLQMIAPLPVQNSETSYLEVETLF